MAHEEFFQLGTTTSRDEIDALRTELGDLRELVADVEISAPTLIPPGVDGWTGDAATRYAERLHGLNDRLASARAALADAESEFEQRIATLEAELRVHEATTVGCEWPTR